LVSVPVSAVALFGPSFGFLFSFVADLLLMLFELRFRVSTAVTDSFGLGGSGMAVLPLPSRIIHPGCRSRLVLVRSLVLTHTG
jgi:hypothetical protein